MNMRIAFPVSLARTVAIVGFSALVAFPASANAGQPSYATGGPSPEAIKGTIFQITGRYTLTLEDERGFEDSITLRAGTIITPTGLALGAGQVATLTGHTDGKTFDADEIDIDPATISTGQTLLPASDYSSTVGDPGAYPAYAFGFAGYGMYGNDGYANPYASGYYGVYAPAYYYGYGAGYNGNGSGPQTGPQPVNPEGGTPRRPVRVPVQNPPPGYRYPTGGNRLPPARVSPPTTYRAPAPAPAAHVAPAPAPPTRGR